jgi:tetratricopeptide (TPR) repeat protein
MLETIRQLALARLAKNEVEKHETERRHAKYFVEEAVASEQDLGGTDLRDCMDRFKTEQDNMRAAFAWSLKKDPEMALRFAYALSAFWNMLGQLTEERKGLNAALEAGKEAPARLQIRVLGRAAVRQSDLEFAKSLARKHLTLSRLIENPWEEAWALHNLGKIAQAQAESDKARAHQNEALTLFQRLEDKRGMAMTLLNLCVVALDQRELGLARRFGTESLKLSEEVGNRGDLPIAQCYLAFVSHKEGKEAEAEALIRESVDMLRKDERKSWLPWGLHWQGRIATGRGDFETARTVLVDSLTLFQINEDSYGIIRSLLAFSWLNARQAHWDQAAILLAAEESLRTVPEAPDWKEEIKFIRDGSEGNLDPASYANAREKGAQLSWDQAVSFALGMS